MVDSAEKSLQRLERELRRVSGSPGIAGGAPMSAEFLLSRIVDVVSGWSPAAGATDHGDLDGLADDDHTQYLKEKASGGAASEVPEHTHAEAAEGGTLRASGVAVFNSTNFAISTSGEGAVTMNSETFDTDGYHDTSSNSERLTIPAGMGGKFGFNVSLRIDNNLEGYATVRKNAGADLLYLINFYTGLETLNVRSCSLSGVIELDAGDYIYLTALAANAQNILAPANGGNESWFSIWRLGD